MAVECGKVLSHWRKFKNIITCHWNFPQNFCRECLLVNDETPRSSEFFFLCSLLVVCDRLEVYWTRDSPLRLRTLKTPCRPKCAQHHLKFKVKSSCVSHPFVYNVRILIFQLLSEHPTKYFVLVKHLEPHGVTSHYPRDKTPTVKC